MLVFTCRFECVYLERVTSVLDTDTLLERACHSAPSSWYKSSPHTLICQCWRVDVFCEVCAWRCSHGSRCVAEWYPAANEMMDFRHKVCSRQQTEVKQCWHDIKHFVLMYLLIHNIFQETNWPRYLVESRGAFNNYDNPPTKCVKKNWGIWEHGIYCVFGYMCVWQEDVCKPLGVSLHAVSNGAAPPPAVLPAAAVLPAYSTLPLMPSFLGAPHPAAATPSPVTHTHTATTDWNTYYYVSKEKFLLYLRVQWEDVSAASLLKWPVRSLGL